MKVFNTFIKKLSRGTSEQLDETRKRSQRVYHEPLFSLFQIKHGAEYLVLNERNPRQKHLYYSNSK
jgi:hypothetical protein